MPDVEMDHLVDKDILDVILLQVEAAADSYGTFSTEGISRVAADGGQHNKQRLCRDNLQSRFLFV